MWRAIQWLLYALFLLVFWPAMVLSLLGNDIADGTTRFLTAHPSVYLTGAQLSYRPLYVYWVVCLSLALVVTGRNYARLRDPGSRRRIRWVVAALMIALIPFVGLTLAFRVAA